MILKNSFWVSLKENNKRRIWLWILSALVYIIAFPVMAALVISMEKAEEARLIANLGETLGREMLRNNMLDAMLECLGVQNYVFMIAAAALAVVSAMQGFSYLYHKNKIDFYMGMPVKRSRRFAVIWLNGILVYLLPNLLGTLLTWLVVAGNGILTAEIVKESLLATGMVFCFYLGIYHLAILAVMLTGHALITLLFVMVFFLYEFLVRVIIDVYSSLFYRHYSSLGDGYIPVLSPFTIYDSFASAHAQGTGNGFAAALKLILFAAAVLLLAYICYRKRPAEAAGKAMTFEWPKLWIKLLLAVPVSLAAGYVVSEIVDYDPLWETGNPGLVFLIMALVLVFACCFIQVLYEFDIRGIFHKKRHIALAALITVMVFLIFRYDLTGFDSYVPKEKAVSSVAVITPSEYYYHSYYMDENLTYCSKSNYMLKNMYLTEPECVEALNRLLEKSIESTDQVKQALAENDSGDAIWQAMQVAYRMKNKRTVYRTVYVNLQDSESVDLLDTVEGSEAFIQASEISSVKTLEALLEKEDLKVTATYGTSVYFWSLSEQEMEELLTLYKEDVKTGNFSKIRESIPGGCLDFVIEKKEIGYTSSCYFNCPIYPFYTNCVEYLKARGYYMESFLNAEDVERIKVVRYSEDDSQTVDYDLAASSVCTSAVYEDEDSIQKLSSVIYPTDWIWNGWSMAVGPDYDYEVYVYFKNAESLKDASDMRTYQFRADMIPEFVIKDTEP